jgi:hypothetical protein
MKRESQFAHTFEDFIRTHGAPAALLSDNAHAQIGKQALQILRMYAIDDLQCIINTRITRNAAFRR